MNTRNKLLEQAKEYTHKKAALEKEMPGNLNIFFNDLDSSSGAIIYDGFADDLRIYKHNYEVLLKGREIEMLFSALKKLLE